MDNPRLHASSAPRASALSANKVLRNTYALLSATLIFSALMAMVSTILNVGHGTSLACSVGALLLVWFVLPRTANSAAGIGVVFAFTGLLGFGLGPILNHYLNMAYGSEVIATSMGGTAIIFLGLSAYALITQRDFSFLGGFLFAGLIVVLLASLAGIFLNMPGLWLAINAAVILIFSGFILFDTSRIINGGVTNYIIATTSIYLSIYNIFIALLHLLGFASND
ncbi:MAG: Bax inhibitor-1/YccA family protein [Gammaproteobacteria bacterium]|nr:Bax inhibitor-1/YccA family protein [Gammaproteobacteria bacterium]